MMGCSTEAPIVCLAWPTGEFGGMGRQGPVRFGCRKELEALANDTRRWITTILDSAPEMHRAAIDPMAPPRRPDIDTW